jgi:RNA polymerase sigma-70 factor (ECF subfamily)
MRRPKHRVGQQAGSEPQDLLQLREALFLQACPFASRAAQVRAVMAIPRHPDLEREDLEQDALLRLWLALIRFDPARASLRTFVERVVTSSVASLVRRTTAKKRTKTTGCEPAAESLHLLVRVELRLDLHDLLGDLGSRDRRVAGLLMENSPAQVARTLRISRTAVYRSIDRIRAALLGGGYR